MVPRRPEQPRQKFVRFVFLAVLIQFGVIVHFHFSPSIKDGMLGGWGETKRGDSFGIIPVESASTALASWNDADKGSQRSPSQKWAYAFLMAGCDSKTRGHVGYLYNIMASSHILKASGSKADVVAMVRMSSGTDESALLFEEEKWLKACGVKIKYLPKMRVKKADSFYTAMMDKFRVLDLVEYSRVIFMDSDAIPLCNMDYIFEMSECSGQLEENLVIAWKFEPSQGGFFMLKPGLGELEKLEEVVRIREEKSKELPWPPFDEKEGWGHVIKPPDHWVNFHGRKGTKWDWYGVFADQGLLYMWTKYVKMRVSIVINKMVQNWGRKEDQGKLTVFMKESHVDILNNKSCSKSDPFGRGSLFHSAPYRDFHHFTGRQKPWIGQKAKEVPAEIVNISDASSPTQLWFHALRQVAKNHDMGIDLRNMRAGTPPLGLYPTWYQMFQKRTAGEEEKNSTEVLLNHTRSEAGL